VDLTGLKLPEQTVQSVRVRGIAPERAPFDLRAALPGPRGTVQLKLERLPLAQFTPYASRAADLRISKGELSLDAKAELAKAGATGTITSRLVAHQLAISSGANAVLVAGLPPDLALALLRDPAGDIALPIPISYGERGARADIAAILAGALRAAITSAVSSPIKVLGMALPEDGAAPLSFAPVGFAPGDATAGDDAAAQLAPLAALLAQRPGLSLALVGRAGEVDRRALAERIQVERIAADRDLPDLPDAGFLARRRVRSALADRGRGKVGALDPEDQALLERYLDATAVPPERFADLARRRAEAVRELLAKADSIAPSRLSAGADPAPGSPEVVAQLHAGAASG
jgi:hypothetical protein